MPMRMQKLKNKLFFLTLVSLTFLGTTLVGREMLIGEGEFLPGIWLAGFGILFFNVAYLSLLTLLSLVCKAKPLPEVYVGRFPKVALCYFIRNEKVGLFERMDWSFKGNTLPNIDFWILSDSDELFEEAESKLVGRLSERHGARVFYRRRDVPLERKQGNIRDFVDSHPEYDFLYICDADSLVPRGTVLRLLKKALNRGNQDAAIFQTFIRNAHAKTYYARFDGIASETSQRLYFETLQAFFGQSISFGHQCLARRELLEKIDLPKGLLSHDNWDTALLDQMGYRVVFCADVETFDEAPANYLESRRRESRWMRGTLQGRPILSMKGLRPAIRFLTFYGIYCYLAQPVFFVWVLIGLLSQSYFMGELLSFKTDAIWFGLFVNKTVALILAFSLAVVFFHKLAIVRSRRDLKRFAYELFLSTLIYSGNFVYVTIDLVTLPLKKLSWRPMKKNPFEELSLTETAKVFFPGTVLGTLGFWYLCKGTPFPQWSALPILFALALSIPVVFLSSKSSLRKENFS